MLSLASIAKGAALPPTVGLSLWQTKDGASLFTDLVNYDLNADADTVQPAENLTFRVRLPTEWKKARAVTPSPDGEKPAAITIEDGWAIVRLPRLHHFASIKLTQI